MNTQNNQNIDNNAPDNIWEQAAQNSGFASLEEMVNKSMEMDMQNTKITAADYSAWLESNNPKSVAIVCMDGYGDSELAKAIKNHNSSTHVHLFEPGNFMKEDSPAFDFIMFGHDLADQDLSNLQHGEFVVR